MGQTGNCTIAVEAPGAVTFAEAVEVEAEMSEEEPEITVFNGPPTPVVASETAPVALPSVPSDAAGSAQPTTPRMSPTTRLHDHVPDDHESKKARTTEQKRQRIERLSAEYSNMIRSVKVANDEFYTMDDYDADLQVENEFDAADPWWDEDQVKVDQMPMYGLWNCGVIIQLMTCHHNLRRGWMIWPTKSKLNV